MRRRGLLLVLTGAVLAGCATAPAPTARERTVSEMVLAFDASGEHGGEASCRSRKVATAEVTRPLQPGSQGAAGRWTERWTVDRCGRITPYLVEYMRAPDGHLGIDIVREAGLERAAMPGDTLADLVLQRDTFLLLAQKDLSESEGAACRSRRVTQTEVVRPVDGAKVEDGRPVAGQWEERWTLDRCGTPVRYTVHFVTNPTGTVFTAEREK